MKFELKPIKTWSEKSKIQEWRPGTLRIYISNLHLGWAEPVRGDEEMFKFKSRYPEILFGISPEKMPLSDILMHIEYALKEFAKKIIK